VPVGEKATIIRFLKGVYNIRPPKPNYVKTWDVSKVLLFLQKLSPAKCISLKELTLKITQLKNLKLDIKLEKLN
jgi:hypothetical protein